MTQGEWSAPATGAAMPKSTGGPAAVTGPARTIAPSALPIRPGSVRASAPAHHKDIPESWVTSDNERKSTPRSSVSLWRGPPSASRRGAGANAVHGAGGGGGGSGELEGLR